MVCPDDSANRVIVSGRDPLDTHDIFMAIDLQSGKRRWTYQYPSAMSLDYGNSPRATPVCHGGVLVTLGAAGILSGLDPASGAVLWKIDLVKQFNLEIPTWGFCGSPMVIDDTVYVQVADDPSIIAINRFNGKIQWTVSGNPAAYASMMPIHHGRQLVGVDEKCYFLRNAQDGQLVWSAEPKYSGDFGVPTPVLMGDHVVFTSENNGVQLFSLSPKTQDPKAEDPHPIAVNESLIPDTHTPVVVGNRLLVAHEGLHLLDIRDGLKESWVVAQDAITGYASIIASNRRALVTTEKGQWILVSLEQASTKDASGILLDHRPLTSKKTHLLSHPAIHGDRLVIRVGNQVRCYRLGFESSEHLSP